MKIERNQFTNPQALKLSSALRKLGIKHRLVCSSGQKHATITIKWAKINLEIDDRQNLNSPTQTQHNKTGEKGFITIRVPNERIDENANYIAKYVAMTAKGKYLRAKRKKKNVASKKDSNQNEARNVL